MVIITITFPLLCFALLFFWRLWLCVPDRQEERRMRTLAKDGWSSLLVIALFPFGCGGVGPSGVIVAARGEKERERGGKESIG